MTLDVVTQALVSSQEAAATYRTANALVAMVAVGFLAYRQVGRWNRMSWLSRCVVALLGSLTTIAALASARAVSLEAPFNELQYALTVHYLCTIVVCLAWHRLLDPTGKRL